MSEGLIVVIRSLIGSLACVVVGAIFASMTTNAGVVAVNQGTAHEALYGLCLSEGRAIAVGQGGLVLESLDGGETWNERNRFTDAALLDVDCGPRSQLYAGQGGALYRQTGESLEALQSGTDARLMSVAQSRDGDLAVAVGAFGTILVSVDQGFTWSSASLDWFAVLDDYVEPHLYDVHISAGGQITVVGEFALVMQSDDAGLTWQRRHRAESSLFGLYLDASGTGYAVGQEGTVLATGDGGETWAAIPTPTNDILLNIHRSDSGAVLATGIRKFIVSHDQGATWTEYDSPALTTGWYQGLVLLPAEEASAEQVMLAGHQANILKIELQ